MLEGRTLALAKIPQADFLPLLPDDAAAACYVHFDIATIEPIACG